MNPAVLVELRLYRWWNRVRGGGCSMGFCLGVTTASFVYITHSAVVMRCESARTLPTREKGGDESDPPQKRGGM